jgi:PAS domain S-box-containing protein
MHAAVQAAPIGWVVTDAEGTVQWVNPGFTRLTGYTAAEVVGQNPRVLKSDRQSPEVYAGLWQTIKDGEVWSGEMFNRRKDGTEYSEHMTIVPVRAVAGPITHFVAIKQDITERKSLELQVARTQRLESVGLLASGIAHDLNNIFAPILLSLELLKLKYPEAETRQMLELVEAAGHRGASIVRQVLTFARGMDGERTNVQPKYLVRELAQMIGETLPRNITIETRLEPGLHAVEADATQLHQVLLNLAVNARDAMPDGGRLTLGAANVAVDEVRAFRNLPLRPGPFVALTVTDTGSGITPAVMEHMFEPFYTTKPRGKGTGLGLSTVYGIVRSHGGVVEVSSQLGRGTCFTVLLPAIRESVSGGPARPVPPAALAGAGRRVLVVDDEESIRVVSARVLTQHGFVVETAVDGVEALEKFRADPARFAVVVTDLMMPRMGGRDLVREIRRLAPDLPVICSSGLMESEGEAGATDAPEALPGVLLRKPYGEKELLAVIREGLGAGEGASEKKG